MNIKEGAKVHYMDSWGDVHKARVCYIYDSVQGNKVAQLSDGATKRIDVLTEAKQ